MLKINKRGFVQDYLFFIVFIVIFAIIIIVGSKLQTDVNEQWNNQDVSQASLDIMNENTLKYYDFMDYIFFTVFFLFMLALLSGVFLLNTHPFLYWISVIILGVSLIPIGILSNMFNEFIANENISGEAARFGLINAVFSNPVLIFGALGILIIILLLSKNR